MKDKAKKDSTNKYKFEDVIFANSAKKKKPLSRRSKVLIIIGSVLGALLIAAVIVGIIHYNKNEDEPFDYIKADISQYIYMPSAEGGGGYKGYTVTVSMDRITEKTVQSAINKMMIEYRKEAKSEEGDENAVIELGDDILLYYKVYSVKEDDTRGEHISGWDNFSITEEKNRTCTVGAGSLDDLGLNLELELIGKDLSKYASCSIKNSGTIRESDIIFLTYSSMVLKDGEYKAGPSGTQESINLALTDMNALFGTSNNGGFGDMLIGNTVDAVNEGLFTDIKFETDEYEQIYYNVKVEYIMRTTANQDPLSIKTTIPCDSSADSSLKGKKIIIDLYIDHAIHYEMPTLDADFIKNEMLVTDATLNKYEGADEIERFYAYIEHLLTQADEAEISGIRLEAMWQHYYSIAEFKALPTEEVERLFSKVKAEIEAAYAKNNKGYDTLDKFANAYVSDVYETTLTWTQYFKQQAEAEVMEKLIFYYVAKAENLLPNDAEYQSLATKIIEEDIAYELYQNGVSSTDAAAQEYRQKVLDYYSDPSVLRYAVDYEYAIDKMIMLSVIEYVYPSEG